MSAPWRRVLPRIALLTVAAAIGAFGARLAAADPDPAAFLAAGHQLLGPHALHVFDTSYLQVGPVYLLLLGALGTVADSLGVDSQLLVSLACAVVIALAADRMSGTGGDSGPAHAKQRRWAALAGVVVALPLVATTGHFEDLLCGVALLSAARAVGAGHQGRAGVWLGAALGLKSWGVLGVPLLLVLPTARRRIGAGALAALLGLVEYAPFLLWGHLQTARHVWRVVSPSALSLVLPAGTRYGVALRGLQVLLALSVASAALLRREPRRAWETGCYALLSVLAVRLLTDPYPQSYYVAPVLLTLCLLGPAAADLRRLGALAAAAVVVDLAYAAPGFAGACAQLVAGAFVLVFALIGLTGRFEAPFAAKSTPVAPSSRVRVASI